MPKAESITERPLRILVTGGGTGGHVSPALAVVQTIREQYRDRQIDFLYVGSLHGVEKELAEAAGIKFEGVQTGKLRRSRSPLGMLSGKNIADMSRIPVGVSQAFAIVKRYRPDVVFATGGYVSVPPVIAASLLHIPVLIHEQTAAMGLANRIAGRYASRIALTFDGVFDELPPAFRKRAFVTGNPMRQVIFGGDRARAIEQFGFDPKDDALPALYVTGGAQGARVINKAVGEALPELLTICRIVHQSGRQPAGSAQDFEMLTERAASLSEELRRRYFVTRFVNDEIGDAFALADLVIGRSGAGTVTELCALGKPAIYVPLVPTSGDEQNRNARRSADLGAAVIVPSAELTGARLLAEVQKLIADPACLKTMGAAALTLAKPEAAEELAKAVVELARLS